MTTSPRRFSVALSFPGEHRAVVEAVAARLAARLGRERVLYDAYYEAEFARPDLDTYLQGLYHDESELIVVFLCAEYERKEWCGLEWRAVRDLIKRRQAAAVMPLRFDATEIPGLFSIDGYAWIRDRSPEAVAGLILERLRIVSAGKPAPEPQAKSEPIAPPPPVTRALTIWQEKLEFLLEQEATTVDADQKFRLRKLIEEAREKIRELGGQAEARAKLEELHPRARPVQADGPRVSLERLPKTGSDFLGRGAELALLDAEWAESGRTHAVVLVAPGGVGKTALIKRWLEQVKGEGWRGARRVYGWSFYSQGTSDDRQASEDSFLDEALRWFEVEHDPASSPSDKGRLLAVAVSGERTLLVLDGVEPLQHPPGPLGGRLRAPGVDALLQHIVLNGQPGLCVLTTRERLTDLDEYERTADHPQGAVVRHDLGNLDERDAGRLLQRLGVRRAGEEPITEEDSELRAAGRELRGHALALTLLGRYLALAHGGDVRKRDQVRFEEADAQIQGGHAFRVMGAYETWLASGDESARRALAAVRLLGLFDRPAEAACLEALRREPAIAGLTEPLFALRAGSKKPVPISDAEWSVTLGRLGECGLVLPGAEPASGANKSQALDAHPLVREHFARRLREGQSEAWREGHRRLYEHLKASVPHRPDGLAGLQPLYQAVVHGCHAALHQRACDEVYCDRILRGTGNDAGNDAFYSWRKLGAIGADLGAVACFFKEPWERLAPGLAEADQAWLLNEAALRLRSLGRLVEAREPMRAGLRMAVRFQDWKNAAISAGNLSELALGLGEVAAALRDAEESVAFADRSGDWSERMINLTTLADALHQAGRCAEALERFREAERLQVERQPQHSLLYSGQGSQYCDRLLAVTERAAARQLLRRATFPAKETAGLALTEDQPNVPHLDALLDVERRAQQNLAWATAETSLLDIALSHLTLGRAALYRAEGVTLALPRAPHTATPPQGPASAGLAALITARKELAAAVDGFRAAGTQHYLPLGLLSRTWLRALDGDREGALADLDEARRIAQRGAMRLHLADAHLARARLFRDRKALAEARRLVKECGYHRRDGELDDAEAAAIHWPEAPDVPGSAPASRM